MSGLLPLLLAVGCAVAAANEEAGHGEHDAARSFHVDHTGGAVFMFAAVLLGILSRSAGRWLLLPYTVVLLVSRGAMLAPTTPSQQLPHTPSRAGHRHSLGVLAPARRHGHPGGQPGVMGECVSRAHPRHLLARAHLWLGNGC